MFSSFTDYFPRGKVTTFFQHSKTFKEKSTVILYETSEFYGEHKSHEWTRMEKLVKTKPSLLSVSIRAIRVR